MREVATLGLFLAVHASSGTAFAQAPAPLPPQRFSAYGDPSAPNVSGVWVRTDPAPVAQPGAASKEGWLPWPPPLKPPFDAVWQKRVTDAAAGARTDDPVRGCLPPGMPRFMTGTNGALLITQTPGRVTMYREVLPVRRVWLDGRPVPKPEALESFFNGTASGHYDGKDLVIDVVGLKDAPIDSTGVPHSGDLQIAERYHRVDDKTLTVEVTLTDPTAYAEPMKTTVTYKAVDDPSWEPKEFICTPVTDFHPDEYVH